MDRNSVKRRVPSRWFLFLALLIIPALVGAGQEKNKKEEKPEVQHPARERKAEQPRPQRQVQQSRPQPQVRQSRPQPERREQRPAPSPGTYGRQPQTREQNVRLPSPQTPSRQPQMRQQERLPSPQTQGQQPQMQEQRRLPGSRTNGQSPNIQRPGSQGTVQPSQVPSRTTINPSRGTQPRGGFGSRTPVVMSTSDSRKRIDDLNSGRRGMAGINRNRLPQGIVSKGQNGRQTITTHDGRRIDVRPNNTVASVHMTDGRQADFRADGRIRSFRAPNGMVVEHGLRGGRRIVTTGPRGDRVVSMGPHRGYYERPYVRGYYQRTYWAGGRPYARIYRPVRWRGYVYYRYVPVRYYHPVFYAWAYRPWPGPVYYTWDWYMARPAWYVYYGPYFAPSPWYLTASMWLTDFLIAQELQAAWQAQQDANAAAAQQSAEYAQQQANVPPPGEAPQGQYEGQGQPSDAGTITPEVKQLIADEVHRQLQAEQSAAANPQQAASVQEGDQPPLDPSQQVFVVSSNLDTMANGQDCELTPGDVLFRIVDTPNDNQTFTMKVTSSKASDCPVRSTVEVSVEDLQEMQNDFRAKLDDGMDSLAKDQGKGGVPAAPDTATSSSGAPAPSPDSAADVQEKLQQQQAAANVAEGQVQQQALEEQATQGNP
jgi:hypothetical protein